MPVSVPGPAGAAGASGTASIPVYDEGVVAGTATVINAVGAGIAATYSGGTAVLTVSGGGGTATTWQIQRYTGGDITLNNTTLTAVTGPTDLTIAAASGDLVMVGVSARPNNTTAQSIAFDFATIVSASPVNYVSAASGTPINIPVPWFLGAGEQSAVGGTFPYVVQSGDISGGNVVFRLYFRTSGSRVISAQSTIPLVTFAVNLHH